ncbi:MAG: HEAT repeat domain-containing protein [Planctomycetes bacterium]|nr:HEAT repeat domain-containing protein [Planctomycetota bacterium]
MSSARRARWPWFVVSLLLAAAIAVGYWRWLPNQGDTTAYWQRHLATMSDAEAVAMLDQLSTRGDEGIAILAASMASQRRPLAQQSATLLRSKLDEWELLSPRAATPRLMVLADALSNHVQQYDADARNSAAEFITRILLWPIDAERVDRPRLNVACQRVLQAIASGEAAAAKPAGSSDQVTANLTLPQMSRADRGGVQSDLPPGPPQMAMNSGAPRVEPRRLPPAATTQARNIDAGDTAASNMPARVPENDPSAPTLPTIAAVNYSNLNVVQLCSYLNDAEASLATAAKQELAARGISARQMEVGAGVTNPDPSVRRRFAEMLPGMTGIDAKPWLMHLSNDEDASVRLTAMTLMATSRDPAMLARVTEMARTDNDERVRYQASRIMESMNDKR